MLLDTKGTTVRWRERGSQRGGVNEGAAQPASVTVEWQFAMVTRDGHGGFMGCAF